MATVIFDNEQRYALATVVAGQFEIAGNASTRTLQITDGHLAHLLQRLARGEPTVLPVRHASADSWLVTADLARDLEATLSSVARFIVPTYAEYVDGVPTHRFFQNDAAPFGAAAHLVYGAGYYELRSPTAHFGRILSRLGQWVQLEKSRPVLQIQRLPTYRAEMDAFTAALAATDWTSAEDHLERLSRYGLTNGDNLLFLRIQLLAQQRRWSEIWQRSDFTDAARLHAPRLVKAALLAAFHQSELLPLEQSDAWVQALERFQNLRYRLGSLLEGQPNISYGPALRVFAYREASAGNRAVLQALLEQTNDSDAQRTISALLMLLPSVPTVTPAFVVPALTAEQVLRRALTEGDYTQAWAAAQGLETPRDQSIAMLETAFFSDDTAHAEEALLSVWALPRQEQERLLQNRRLAQIFATLQEVIAPPPSALDEPPLNTWLDWLATAVKHPEDTRLIPALEVLQEDERYWTENAVSQASGYLVELASGTVVSRTPIREAIQRLRAYFLLEPEFPRTSTAFGDIYEALYTATLEQHDTNETSSLALLRLAEARLRQRPDVRNTVAGHLISWFDTPFPALEQTVLEAFDLLAAYGVQGSLLARWYRQWLETLFVAPRSQDRLTLESWLAFGQWIQPGDDLLQQIRERLNSLDSSDDPILRAPHGLRIAIFTLRPESASRVSQRLRERRPDIQVDICDDTVLTDRASNLAQHSGMNVVVTTCITHALTYGIGPYLNDPVYPQSSGSTSIMRAIEERLARV